MSGSSKVIEKLVNRLTGRQSTLLVSLLIVCLVLDAVLWESDDSVRRSLAVIQQQRSLHPQYETMIPPNVIDYSVDERLNWQSEEGSNSEHCKDILLLMPYEHAINGQGAQLNAYVWASLLATFLNKALVILESPNYHYLSEWNKHRPATTLYDSGSQFGCPADAFQGEEINADFPRGLSRLIQNPIWVSRGCGVPTCGGKFGYDEWEAIRKIQKSHVLQHGATQDVHCVEGDMHTTVTVLGISSMNRMTRRTHVLTRMTDRSSESSRSAAYHWAMRLGASSDEARVFSRINSPNQIWDYLSALINRSGLLRFQPWIARDVEEHIRSLGAPLDGPYDAIHVRRGDKLIAEARREVQQYWVSKGYGAAKMPTNYIPFSHYVEKVWGSCTATGRRKMSNMRAPPRNVYVATDDPSTVRGEINSFPKVRGKGASIIDECNTKVKFWFAPSTKDTSFHINDRRSNDSCHQVYKRNIAAIADLVILSRADKFVGDYNSNWGRFIKITRSFLNDRNDTMKPLVSTRDMIVAFGPGHPGPPGM
ncbi:hypothetical protein ACHAW6_001768 [Cyclotella cf. meneghiniana]